MIQFSDKVKAAFEEKHVAEPNSGCWLWIGATEANGYGRIYNGKKVIRAHRLSYQIHKGEIGTMHVLHRCDNRLCVNPDHLFLGTNNDNIADRHTKGRTPKGRDLPQAKLTSDQVKEIRNSAEKQKTLAAKFGVTQSLISRVRSAEVWSHV